MTDTPGPNRSKQKRLELLAFIKEVASRMFLPEETILATWETMTTVLVEALLRDEKVVLRKFGVFRLGASGTMRFRSAVSLKQFLKENTMEKYGVEISNEAALLAKVTGQCPACKQELESKDPPKCPACGTAPFEAKFDRQTAMAKNFGTLYGKSNDQKDPDQED